MALGGPRGGPLGPRPSRRPLAAVDGRGIAARAPPGRRCPAGVDGGVALAGVGGLAGWRPPARRRGARPAAGYPPRAGAGARRPGAGGGVGGLARARARAPSCLLRGWGARAFGRAASRPPPRRGPPRRPARGHWSRALSPSRPRPAAGRVRARPPPGAAGPARRPPPALRGGGPSVAAGRSVVPPVPLGSGGPAGDPLRWATPPSLRGALGSVGASGWARARPPRPRSTVGGGGAGLALPAPPPPPGGILCGPWVRNSASRTGSEPRESLRVELHEVTSGGARPGRASGGSPRSTGSTGATCGVR